MRHEPFWIGEGVVYRWVVRAVFLLIGFLAGLLV